MWCWKIVCCEINLIAVRLKSALVSYLCSAAFSAALLHSSFHPALYHYVCVCQHPHHGKQIPRGHSCGTAGPSQCFASDHDNNDNRLFMTPRLTKSPRRLHRRIGVHIHHVHKRTPSPWRGNVHFQSISGFLRHNLPPPPPPSPHPPNHDLCCVSGYCGLYSEISSPWRRDSGTDVET